ncbi:hypothetical protein RR42_m4204 [Cupriavidus basilensis]|uniref:Uncharacterized protein n=1 Tax=Cupriavidus basilensis TaxID=68895 RepID=A0A0C4YLS3_9BURK|nr:hypothetical protein RR42_m4204 [Cupriavidus basilensis]
MNRTTHYGLLFFFRGLPVNGCRRCWRGPTRRCPAGSEAGCRGRESRAVRRRCVR